MYQLRNKLNRTNVVNKPKNGFNACEDFMETVTAGLIIAATSQTLNMKSNSDPPTDPKLANCWTLEDSRRKDILLSICEQVYDQFIGINYNSNVITNSSDSVHNYTVQLLRLGCLFLEFADAIREGDGNRVHRCWKYMLIIFSGSGNKNYACEAANLLIQCQYTLSPRQSAQLLWSRFINVHGIPGMNIPTDLHMEHLNRLAKEAINFLGANKSEKAIQRVGRALGTLSPVLDNFDSVHNVQHHSGKKKAPDAHKDILVVADEIRKADGFCVRTGRKHKQFPHPKNALQSKPKTELVEWLVSKLPQTL